MSLRRLPLGRLLLLFGWVALIGWFDLFLNSARSPGVAADTPRLLVLVVFDQLRGDYLTRWNDLLEKDGFHRLETDGAWFSNCHYPYAHTVTAAGHASLLTGCSPDRHGIVGNTWYERGQGATVYCVGSARHELVPSPPVARENARRKGKPQGASPDRLLAPTLGDAMKEATDGRSRVVALSLKDRSAVLPAGRRPDACYWFEEESGRFVTSTYYRGRPHDWVAEFNQHSPRVADRWFGQNWDRLRDDVDYDRRAGPDDMPGENKGFGQGRTFPHPLGAASQPGRDYYLPLYNSPFGNQLLLEFAKRAIDAEQLGKGPAPDLLCISFSSNDAIGHTWGPDSQEVLDATLRSDLIVRDLLKHLDERVGRGRYALALSADHGVCPLPEVSQKKGLDAKRVQLDVQEAETFLTETFGGDGGTRWLEKEVEPWFYLNRRLLAERRLQPAQVEESLAGWLRRQPGVLTAYTRTQWTRGIPPEDEIGKRVRKSFQPDRSGDVAVVLKPYYLRSSAFGGGTTHGQPHPYDTHVPLLIYGPGISGGRRSEAVTPQAIAAIFARFLGIAPPAWAEAEVPKSL